MKIKLILIAVAISIIAVIAISRTSSEPAEQPQLTRTYQVDSPIKGDEDIIKEPLMLEIPKIGVESQIEYVGMLANGQMDVPKVYANVAWYQDGYYPGERGNAVVSGHVDTPGGARAVFADLDKLEIGDLITIRGKDKHTVFQVYDKKVYAVATFPIEEVFGKTQERNLNLITCEGERVNGRYNDRLVVFARTYGESKGGD